MADNLSPIHRAVRNNDIEAVEKLLLEGVDVNTISEDGDWMKSPLDETIICGFQQIALLLLERGGKLNCMEHLNPFVLHVAAFSRRELVVKSLLEKGFDVNEPESRHGDTALHMSRTSEITEILLANGARVNVKNNSGQTPIYYAAIDGEGDIVRSLVGDGADVNLSAVDGSTPLHAAVRYLASTHLIAEILLANGANVNARTIYGASPLHMLNPEEHDRVMVVEEILKQDVDINAEDSYGLTPLHRAVHCAEIVRMYLMRGANINIGSNEEETPLERAQRHLQDFQPTSDNNWLKSNLQLASEYLVRTIIKLTVAGLYVSKKNINMADSIMRGPNDGTRHKPNGQLHEYDLQCRLESHEMRLRVGISLKDFLATKYPSYISNSELCEKLENINNSDYPIYGDLSLGKFKRDKDRFLLLEPCKSLFARSEAEPTPPGEIWEEILSNLSDTELKRVVDSIQRKPGALNKSLT